MDSQPTNPKDAAAHDRAIMPPLLPALVEEGLALFEGLSKYGANNYAIVGVRSSVYVYACARHLFKWYFGQEHDAVTCVHHLGNARACLGILLDAQHRKILQDDRPPALPDMDALFERASEVMRHLTALYADRKPRNYTIADTPPPPPPPPESPAPNAYTPAELERIDQLTDKCTRCMALISSPGICASCVQRLLIVPGG